MVDHRNTLHTGRSELRGNRVDLPTDDDQNDSVGHRPDTSQLLRSRDRFPRSPIEPASVLLANDGDHEMTRASSRRRRISSFAAAAGDPLMIEVFLPFSGIWRPTIF